MDECIQCRETGWMYITEGLYGPCQGCNTYYDRYGKDAPYELIDEELALAGGPDMMEYDEEDVS